MICTLFHFLVLQDAMLKEALEEDVCFLVVGDPLGATTHSDLILRAKEMGVKTKVNNLHPKGATFC